VRLYILRHGPAEDHATSGRDADRALTASGRERVRHVARALQEADEAPYLIVSSPLVRALQTAEIVAAVTKLSAPVEVRRELSPGGGGGGDARALVREKLASGSKRVMLVGHEPDLADLATSLSGHPFPAGLQKAMVVGLVTKKDPGPSEGAAEDPQPTPMRLRFVLDPKALEWHYDTP
jgi:phosphohistidine phosphatase